MIPNRIKNHDLDIFDPLNEKKKIKINGINIKSPIGYDKEIVLFISEYSESIIIGNNIKYAMVIKHKIVITIE